MGSAVAVLLELLIAFTPVHTPVRMDEAGCFIVETHYDFSIPDDMLKEAVATLQRGSKGLEFEVVWNSEEKRDRDAYSACLTSGEFGDIQFRAECDAKFPNGLSYWMFPMEKTYNVVRTKACPNAT